MSKILLPFTTDVEAKTYQYSAYELGAITESLNNSHLWAAGKYLSVYFENNDQLHMNDVDPWSVNEGVTTKECMTIKPSTDSSYRKDLLGTIKDKLKTGNYVTGMFDEYFIPQKRPYLKHHLFHDYFVYGFDDSQCVFKAAGYLSNSKYATYDISYDSYMDSITLFDCDEFPLYFHRVNKQYVPKLAITDICNKLEDFLMSRDNLPRQPDEPERIYGISGLRCFQQYIIDDKHEKLDLRNSRSFMEYFHYMYFRLQVLARTGHLHDDTLIEEYYNCMVKPSAMVHNMCIKYSICGDRKLRLRASELISTLNAKEVSNIECLLARLNRITNRD